MIEKALEEWRGIEGVEVLAGTEAHERYHRNTLGMNRSIAGSLRATTVEQIQKIVAIANEHRIPLYAFSTGHDWGFGSSLPTVDHCVILDLSGMKRIVELNEELGYATVEPGVTQQDLYDYMHERGIHFMIPTTGGGPSCSLIGNALEKGYGITPYVDHWSAVMGLEAVLANGSLYKSSFNAFGATAVDPIYKWKLGPYFDGLFAQSNFGIVTQATIALARKPDSFGQFVAFVHDADLEKAVVSARVVAERYGSMIGGINLMNNRRVLSMIEAKETWRLQGIIPESDIHKLARHRGVSDWTVLIGLYCPQECQRTIVKGLRKEFSRYATRTLFLNRTRVRFLSWLVRLVPGNRYIRTLAGFEEGLDVLEGTPSEVALPLAYLKNPHPRPEHHLHPDHDGSGLIWYTPIIPTDPSLVRKFVRGVVDIFVSEKLEPLITLTTISHRVIASNIPIIFNRDDADDTARAHSAFRRMLVLARELGTFPDRIDIETMRELYDGAEGSYFDFADTIKNAVDPNAILSPGRYSRIRR